MITKKLFKKVDITYEFYLGQFGLGLLISDYVQFKTEYYRFKISLIIAFFKLEILVK